MYVIKLHLITDWLRRPALLWDAPLGPVKVVGERRMTAKLSCLMVA